MKSSQKINHFKKLLGEEKVDGILISSVFNITHLTSYANFSSEEREAYLLITEKSRYIFTDGRYAEAVKKQIPDFELILSKGENTFLKNLEALIKKHNIKSLGVDENDLRVSEHKKIKTISKSLKHIDLGEIRSIKASGEIKLIETACKLGDEVFTYIIRNVLKKGITEKEVASEIEMFLKKRGSEISFKPIVAFGANSSVPHHESGNKKLEKGFVLLDLGAKFENYCSDMTRTVFWGKADKKQKKIYKIVKEAQEKAVSEINSKILRSTQNDNKKILANEADKAAREYIIKEGFETIPHSLGHGIGLEVHEHPFLSPKSKDILKEGMVFSIEPGIYIPDFGGVRIEDLFVFEKTGLRRLTKSDNSLIELR